MTQWADSAKPSSESPSASILGLIVWLRASKKPCVWSPELSTFHFFCLEQKLPAHRKLKTLPFSSHTHPHTRTHTRILSCSTAGR